MKFNLASLMAVTMILGLAFGGFAIWINAKQEMERKLECSLHLKVIGLALHTYHDVFNQLPPNGYFLSQEESGNPFIRERTSRGSSLVKLLPYLEHGHVHSKLDFESAGKPWGFEKQIIEGWDKKYRADNYVFGPTFFCPSSKLDLTIGERQNQVMISCYAPSMGAQYMPPYEGYCKDFPGNVFETGAASYGLSSNPKLISGVFARGHWAARFRDITAGMSNVFAFGEIIPTKSHKHRLGWIHADALPTATTAPMNHPIRGIGERGFPGAKDCNHYSNRQTSEGFKSRHKGGAHFLLADGGTIFLNDDIDHSTYQRLGERRDMGRARQRWNNIDRPPRQ